MHHCKPFLKFALIGWICDSAMAQLHPLALFRMCHHWLFKLTYIVVLCVICNENYWYLVNFSFFFNCIVFMDWSRIGGNNIFQLHFNISSHDAFKMISSIRKFYAILVNVYRGIFFIEYLCKYTIQETNSRQQGLITRKWCGVYAHFLYQDIPCYFRMSSKTFPELYIFVCTILTLISII